MAQKNLRITKCEPVYQGTNAQGGSYTIYEVEAADAQTGVLINQSLRSFDRLEVGQSAVFEVEKYEKNGRVSYTLKKPGGGKGGGGNALGPKVDALRSRIELLEENLKVVQANLATLMARFEQAQPPVASGGSIHTQHNLTGGATPADDDIPF